MDESALASYMPHQVSSFNHLSPSQRSNRTKFDPTQHQRRQTHQSAAESKLVDARQSEQRKLRKQQYLKQQNSQFIESQIKKSGALTPRQSQLAGTVSMPKAAEFPSKR